MLEAKLKLRITLVRERLPGQEQLWLIRTLPWDLDLGPGFVLLLHVDSAAWEVSWIS